MNEQAEEKAVNYSFWISQCCRQDERNPAQRPPSGAFSEGTSTKILKFCCRGLQSSSLGVVVRGGQQAIPECCWGAWFADIISKCQTQCTHMAEKCTCHDVAILLHTFFLGYDWLTLIWFETVLSTLWYLAGALLRWVEWALMPLFNHLPS